MDTAWALIPKGANRQETGHHAPGCGERARAADPTADATVPFLSQHGVPRVAAANTLRLKETEDACLSRRLLCFVSREATSVQLL